MTIEGHLLSRFHPMSAIIMVRFDDYNVSNGATFNTWEAYAQSKTGNILFSLALAQKLANKGVKSYSLHPGNIQDTNLSSIVDPAEWPVEQGSATTLVAALDPKLDCEFWSLLHEC